MLQYVSISEVKHNATVPTQNYNMTGLAKTLTVNMGTYYSLIRYFKNLSCERSNFKSEGSHRNDCLCLLSRKQIAA